MKYDPKALEVKWQERWAKSQLYHTPDSPKKKYYVLEMFAYPSGDIHMGHFRNYGIGDAVARYRMMKGEDVLHPFGWDAFGLPAENAAIKNKLQPLDWTLKNVETGKKTLQRMGISYDWDREVRTFDPGYYKWTQWLFLLLYKTGWAYRGPSMVNWCANDGILANEQVHDGKCWRCQGVLRDGRAPGQGPREAAALARAHEGGPA
jgi:leucyl-tRNA synthetase